MLSRAHARGLTLIELMVTITLVGIMLVLAMPGVGDWIANSRVRSTGDEIQNGLRLARVEAMNRNRTVAFVRTSATPALNATPSATGSNWYVQVLPLNAVEGADAAFQNTAFVQGGSFSNLSRATVNGDAVLCFNSVGRVVDNSSTGLGANCVAPTDALVPKQINVTFTTASRSLRAEVFLGGRVRMCDPAAAAGQPNACT